jgi:hypothetical protein
LLRLPNIFPFIFLPVSKRLTPNELYFCLVTNAFKLGNVSQTLTALPPYKGTEKIPQFQIKSMTMCRIRAICHSFKVLAVSLNILQSRGLWHYDIMSDLQMLIKPLHMCIKVYENMHIKICFCGDESL